MVPTIKVPEFTFEMTYRMKIPESDELPVKGLVVPFDLPPAPRMIGSSEDQFDAVFFGFCFEQF